jgi:hypothetical protein
MLVRCLTDEERVPRPHKRKEKLKSDQCPSRARFLVVVCVQVYIVNAISDELGQDSERPSL